MHKMALNFLIRLFDGTVYNPHIHISLAYLHSKIEPHAEVQNQAHSTIEKNLLGSKARGGIDQWVFRFEGNCSMESAPTTVPCT